MPVECLDGRGVIRVAGDEAASFLDRIVTGAIEPVAPGVAGFAALLSPQGKILADFVVHGTGPGEYLLEAARNVVPDLLRRLVLYRLRAKIEIRDVSAEQAVRVGWGDAPRPDGAAPDPRLAALGWRQVVARPGETGADCAYDAHRIACAVPEGGRDFAWGDAFPHEALMDQLGGVDFRKGCYVGQEVVSRMQHRGTARMRVVPVLVGDGAGLPPGTAVTAGERAIGRLGTSAGPRALATLRLDRAAEALAAGEGLTADGHPLRLAPKPDWVRFPWPGEADAA